MKLTSYRQSIGWFLLSLLISGGNDALTKYLGDTLNTGQIAFGRFLFATLTLLPFMLSKTYAFTTQRPGLHLLRGIMLVVAMSLWTYGMKTIPMTTATIISFTIPFFVLVLARVWLRERIAWSTGLVTCLGLGGIVLVLQPSPDTFASPCLVAAFLFSILDILNKKYVTQEPRLSMLFYSTLTAALLMAWPGLSIGSLPAPKDLLLLVGLGIGSNLILYCLLKALALAPASFLAPFRYVEFLISMGLSYVCFQELPDLPDYLGAAIIIPCSLWIGYRQNRDIQ